MKEGMFFDPSVDWTVLEPYQVLTMRACAPNGVFTSTAKTGYLTRVGGNPELSEIADAIFGDDYWFITHLPENWSDIKSELITLMILSYKKGIRRVDKSIQSLP